MTRTQILLPGEVYERARSVAEAKEAIRQEWTLPVLSGMGWRGLDDAEIKALAQKTTLEEELEERQASGNDLV